VRVDKATTSFPAEARPAAAGQIWSDTDRERPFVVAVLGVGNPVVVSGGRDERIAAVAELQRQYIHRSQLRAVGIGDSAVARLIRSGRLIRRYPAVYGVRPLVEMPFGPETAALLACAPNALLSHRSAAALWKLCEADDDCIEVTIPWHRRRRVADLRIHRTACLHPRDVRVEDGLPVTSPARTLLDHAATLGTHELERELDEALVVLKIATREELDDVLARAGTRRGAGRLRRLMSLREESVITKSEAERLFMRLIVEGGLPEPRTQVRLEGFTVDFLWPEERVVFEIDGYRFHTSRSAFDRDRRKDLTLKSAGFDPNRVSRDQVKNEPLVVLGYVARALGRADRRGR
jgi:very-short-patch-repair endonuclease